MRLSRALAVAVALACLPRASFAEPAVGVVVTGDNALKGAVAKYLLRWLADRHFATEAVPMNAEAIDEIQTCLIAGDARCARTVVEAHATTDSVVCMRVAVAPNSNDVRLLAYWFVRGREAVPERRVCEHCQDATLDDVAEHMMGALALGSSQMGKLDLRARPLSLTVLIDDIEVGTTPLVLELPTGKHALMLTTQGTMVAQRDVTIAGGNTTRLNFKVTATSATVETEPPSPIVPLVLMGAGAAGIVAGIHYLYVGTETGEQNRRILGSATPIGVGLTTVGTGLLAGGIVMFLRGRHTPTSTPTAGISPHGAYVGWQARF